MKKTLNEGKFAHIVGTFDLRQSTGTIDYVTPVEIATVPSDGGASSLRLVGEGVSGVVFDRPVHPQRNSCAPNAESGTFEEFVPVTPALTVVKLMVGATVAAEYRRGPQTPSPPVTLAGASPDKPYKLLIKAAAQPTSGVTYSVQARTDSSTSWMTLAVGLDVANSEVNVNQFPGAKQIEVRVLRTDGFSETEVLRQTKTF
jgi:hypothetical protein